MDLLLEILGVWAMVASMLAVGVAFIIAIGCLIDWLTEGRRPRDLVTFLAATFVIAVIVAVIRFFNPS